ncbi:MAG: hypothetical protein ACHREM_00050 [Polyangiales bacterium]
MPTMYPQHSDFRYSHADDALTPEELMFRRAVEAYYSLPGNSSGGPRLRNVIHDGNLKGPSLNSAASACEKAGDWLGLAIIEHLKMLTRVQRSKLCRALAGAFEENDGAEHISDAAPNADSDEAIDSVAMKLSTDLREKYGATISGVGVDRSNRKLVVYFRQLTRSDRADIKRTPVSYPIVLRHTGPILPA